VRLTAATLLRQLGCGGVLVENGQRALACLRERDFALVLLDVSMPVLDGVATLARVRDGAAGSAAGVPIIMVTAYADACERQRLHAAGASGFIAKPIDPHAFHAEVARCLAL
jgi:CheY-like chemotaxis protein